MDPSAQYLVFTLDEQRYALPLSAVERVVRAVEVTPLPKAPEIVLGLVNVRGQVIPVVDIRRRFRLPERAIRLSDQLIIARTSRRPVALLADSATGMVAPSAREVLAPEEVLPHLEYVEGVIKLEDGILLIHDLDTFLSLEEEKALDRAISENQRAHR